MKNNVIKVIMFILIFCILLYIILFRILWLTPNSITYFYNEPKDSLDVVYIGSSNAWNHFNTVLAYDLYGYKTWHLSTGSQPFTLIKYLIQESEKYQDPSLYVIDITKLADDLDSFTGEQIRNVTDAMKFSKNRINAINEALSYKKNINREEYINYYFSFLMYHNSWKKIHKSNIIGNKDLYKSYLFNDTSVVVKPQNTYFWKDDIEELPEENRQILISLINYIKNNNINVLFVIPNRCFDEKINERLNDAVSIIEKYNLDVINCNKIEELNNNIDFSTDLMDVAHLNVYGATKYTLYFSKYLKENYKLPNHKKEDSDTIWNSEYERFKKDYKRITNKNFEQLLKENNNYFGGENESVICF